MAKRQKMTARIHIPINGKQYLWFTVDEDGNVEWNLPRDEAEARKAVQKMLDNIGRHMSDFYANNPEYIENL